MDEAASDGVIPLCNYTSRMKEGGVTLAFSSSYAQSQSEFQSKV
jgi:hypothetical protein